MLRTHFKYAISLIALKLKLILITVKTVASSLKFLLLIILYFCERPSSAFGIKILKTLITVKTLK